MRVTLLLFTVAVGCSATVKEPFYDCQLRQIAIDYTREVVLGAAHGWLGARASSTLDLVTNGLYPAECNFTSVPLSQPDTPSPGGSSGAGVTIYVATTGSDSAAGTAGAPLKTVAGAQALIRSKYPKVSTRPEVTVLIQPGEYYFGEDTNKHLMRATRCLEFSRLLFERVDCFCSDRGIQRVPHGASLV
jgi:hypothetical protein